MNPIAPVTSSLKNPVSPSMTADAPLFNPFSHFESSGSSNRNFTAEKIDPNDADPTVVRTAQTYDSKASQSSLPLPTIEDRDQALRDIFFFHLQSGKERSRHLAVELWKIHRQNIICGLESSEQTKSILELALIAPADSALIESLLNLSENTARQLYDKVANKIEELILAETDNGYHTIVPYLDLLLIAAEAIKNMTTEECERLYTVTSKYLDRIYCLLQHFPKDIATPSGLSDMFHAHYADNAYSKEYRGLCYLWNLEEAGRIILNFLGMLKPPAKRISGQESFFRHCLLTARLLFESSYHTNSKDNALEILIKVSFYPLNATETDDLNECFFRYLSPEEYVKILPPTLEWHSRIKRLSQNQMATLFLERLEHFLAIQNTAQAWDIFSHLVKQLFVIGASDEVTAIVREKFLQLVRQTCETTIGQVPLSIINKSLASPFINLILSSGWSDVIDASAHLIVDCLQKLASDNKEFGISFICVLLSQIEEYVSSHPEKTDNCDEFLSRLIKIHPEWIVQSLNDADMQFTPALLKSIGHGYLENKMRPEGPPPSTSELRSLLELLDYIDVNDYRYWEKFFPLISQCHDYTVIEAFCEIFIDKLCDTPICFSDWLYGSKKRLNLFLNKLKLLKPKDLAILMVRFPDDLIMDDDKIDKLPISSLNNLLLLYQKASQVKGPHKIKYMLCTAIIRTHFLKNCNSSFELIQSDIDLLNFCLSAKKPQMIGVGTELLKKFLMFAKKPGTLREHTLNFLQMLAKLDTWENDECQIGGTEASILGLLSWATPENLKKLNLHTNHLLQPLKGKSSKISNLLVISLLCQLVLNKKQNLTKHENYLFFQACENLIETASEYLLRRMLFLLNYCEKGSLTSHWLYHVQNRLLATAAQNYSLNPADPKLEEKLLTFLINISDNFSSFDDKTQKNLIEQILKICEVVAHASTSPQFTSIISELCLNCPKTLSLKIETKQRLIQIILNNCLTKEPSDRFWDYFFILCDRHLFDKQVPLQFQIMVLKRVMGNKKGAPRLCLEMVKKIDFISAISRGFLTLEDARQFILFMTLNNFIIEFALRIIYAYRTLRKNEEAILLAGCLLENAAPEDELQLEKLKNGLFIVVEDFLKTKSYQYFPKKAVSIISKIYLLTTFQFLSLRDAKDSQSDLTDLMNILKNSRSSYMSSQADKFERYLKISDPDSIAAYLKERLTKLAEKPIYTTPYNSFKYEKDIARFMRILDPMTLFDYIPVKFNNKQWVDVNRLLLEYFKICRVKNLFCSEGESTTHLLLSFFYALIRNSYRYRKIPEDNFNYLLSELTSIKFDVQIGEKLIMGLNLAKELESCKQFKGKPITETMERLILNRFKDHLIQIPQSPKRVKAAASSNSD